MLDVSAMSRLSEEEKMNLLKKMAESETDAEDWEKLCEFFIGDTSASVRRLAIEFLWGTGETRFIEPLMESTLKDEDEQVRASAASVLGTFIYEGLDEESPPDYYFRVRDFLINCILNNANPIPVRAAALEAVSFDPEEEVTDLIDWAYRHEDREMNLSAIFAMGRNHGERWVPHLARELNSDDRERKLEALQAAQEGYMMGLTPILRNLALIKDKELRIHAIWALAHAGGPGALEILELCAESADEETRSNANEAIEEYHVCHPRNYEEDEFDNGQDW